MHFGRRLAVWRHQEDDLDAIDDAGLEIVADQIGRRDQRYRAAGQRLAEPGIDLPSLALRQQRAELILRPAHHRGARQHVLLRDRFDKSFRRNHRHLAAVDVRLRGDALHAAPVVGVRMGVDHRRHRPLAAMLEVKLEARLRGLRRHQRIDHDHAGVALDQCHVGNVEAADLINAGDDLEQAVPAIELRLPPQAGIDGRGAVSLFRKP